MKDNVYVGNIKQCLNIDSYNSYGDGYSDIICYIDGKPIKKTETFTKVIASMVILIKVSETEYVWTDFLSLREDELDFIDLSKNIVKNSPLHTGALFVDEESLIPYFNQVNVRK